MIRYKFSTREVSDAIGDVLKRFPLVLLASLLAAFLGITIIEDNFKDTSEDFVTGVMVCGMAVPFLISLRLFSESRTLAKPMEWGLQLAGGALMIFYWYMLPTDLDDAPFKHWYRFAALALAAHLLVSFAPFTRKGHNTEFWDFNQHLFFRWLIGAVYAGVLFGGIAAAMGAIDALFHVDIDEERYGELWVLCAGVFHPLFFLAGVPRTFANEDEALNYPKMLRWFCVYILVPIVLIYMAILYAYFGKIGIEWSFPRGWVANLGLGFSVAGILALLLVYPVREREDQPFIRLYYRWYFVVLIPVVVLLFLAIGKRLAQYGFTEERYIVLALTIWLALVAVYFIVISRHRIKMIPMTLCVVALLSALGPWSMFSVSKASQMSRLKSFLEKENMLSSDGKIDSTTKSINDSSRVEISQITRYLTQTHSPYALQPLFTKPIDSLITKTNRYDQSNALVTAMGLEYQYYFGSNENNYYDYGVYSNRRFDISGYDAMMMLSNYNSRNNEKQDTLSVRGNMLYVYNDDSNNLVVKLPDGSTTLFDVNAFASKLNAKLDHGEPKMNEMTYNVDKDLYRFKLQFTNINGRKEDGKFKLDSYEAYLLAGIK